MLEDILIAFGGIAVTVLLFMPIVWLADYICKDNEKGIEGTDSHK